MSVRTVHIVSSWYHIDGGISDFLVSTESSYRRNIKNNFVVSRWINLLYRLVSASSVHDQHAGTSERLYSAKILLAVSGISNACLPSSLVGAFLGHRRLQNRAVYFFSLSTRQENQRKSNSLQSRRRLHTQGSRSFGTTNQAHTNRYVSRLTHISQAKSSQR
jgi:hypothetical protein